MKKQLYRPVHILPKEVASQIAAGEVVERPASVVKELIENSIDAGAKSIHIEVKNGGKKLIKVIDDGVGMSASDLKLCIRAHATSKIFTSEDLEKIYTFGFRGEALSSIASVSRLTIITRQRQSDTGWKIQVEFGKEKEIEAVGAPFGTQVIVEDLFLEIPARRKFLKRDSTELSHITHVVRVFATAHPEIRFELTSSNKELFRSLPNPCGSLIVTPLLGEKLASRVLEIDAQTTDTCIWGYISPPEEVRFNTKNFYFFINKRPIRSALLWRATMDAYKGFIQKNSYPLGVVFIEVDPALVDVNVHPTKQEVRFDEPNHFYRLLYHSIKEALESYCKKIHGTIENNNNFLDEDSNIKTESNNISTNDDFVEKIGFFEEQKPSFLENYNLLGDNKELKYKPREKNGLCIDRLDTSSLKETIIKDIKKIEILGQIADSFIVCADKEGLLLIDQHAAHEAILFKEILEQIKNANVVAQRLLMPEILEYSFELIAKIDEAKDIFKSIGLEISDFGKGYIIVHSMPQVLMKTKTTKESIKKIIDLVLENPHLSKELLLREIVASIACHSAIKAGQKLHNNEIKELLDKIIEEQVHHCPHGRPIALRLDLNDLYKSFKR